MRKLTVHFMLAHPRTLKFTEVHSNNLIALRVRHVKFRSKLDQTNNNKFCMRTICKPRTEWKETSKIANNLTDRFMTFLNQYLKNLNPAAQEVHWISIDTDHLILYRKLSLLIF